MTRPTDIEDTSIWFELGRAAAHVFGDDPIPQPFFARARTPLACLTAFMQCTKDTTRLHGTQLTEILGSLDLATMREKTPMNGDFWIGYHRERRRKRTS